MFPFDPPENIRKRKVFSCFQGDQKGTLGRKGLNMLFCMMCVCFDEYVQTENFSCTI